MKKKRLKDYPELKGIIGKGLLIMRLSLILMVVGVLQSAASVYSQNWRMSMNEKSILVKDVLTKIESSSEFRFFYEEKKVNAEKKVDIEINYATIDDIMNLLFNNEGIEYKVLDSNYIVLKPKGDSSSPTINSSQQKKSVTGKVTEVSGVTLPGVSVVVKGTTIGVITDNSGKFSLSNIPENATLQFSFVGMKTQEIVVGNKTKIDVTMAMDAISMDEVVVVGYGTQKKNDITGAVASFDKDMLEAMPNGNIAQVLQGKIAGLNIRENSGSAEGNFTLQIRGVNSITASNAPLIILDGVPFSGNISEISPNDIGSIEVLKDASSASIYGARASNGVLLITTKTGTKGKPTISYNGSYAIDEMTNLPDMMDGNTFYQRKVELMGKKAITPSEQKMHDSGLETNWLDEATRLGQRQDHTISISGGTDNVNYYISGSLNDTKGVAIGDQFKRANIKINFNTKITDWLNIGTNTIYTHMDRGGSPADMEFAFKQNPLNKAYNDDGTLTIYPWPEDVYWRNPLEPTIYIQESISRSLNSNNYAEISLPVKGLKYKLNTGYSYSGNLFEQYIDRNTKTGYENGGRATVQGGDKQEWIIENIVNYSKEFGKSTLFVTGLYSAQETEYKNHQLGGQNFPNDVRTYYQFASTEVLTPLDSYYKTALISQMLRVNYTFNKRYLLTLTARRDGYSGFGKDTKFGTFPSAALGWNINNERFMQDIDWIDVLKLRLSYGKNGNQAIGPYSTLPQLSSADYLDKNKNSAFGYYPKQLGDPTLGWETSLTQNLGVDFGFLKNRIQGSVDVYHTNTTDLLLNKNISPVNGTTTIKQNIGETDNKGIELQISSINMSKNNFSWTTDLTFSLYRNKIVHIGLTDEEGNYIDDIGNNWFVGKPLGTIYGMVYDGVWQLDDDIANSAQPTAKPGDVKVRDVNGDGKISTATDRDFLGNSQPSFTLGLNNTINYKNFTLNFFINTIQGVVKSSPLWTTFFYEYNWNHYNYDFWTESNPTNEFPANRLNINDYGASRREDASFIRLKDVTLTYKFGENITSKVNLDRLEIFVNAKNLITITDYKYGMDPEFSASWSIPLNKTYLFGLRVSF